MKYSLTTLVNNFTEIEHRYFLFLSNVMLSALRLGLVGIYHTGNNLTS